MGNVYEMVTAKIVAELEQGTAPWVKPWKGSGIADLPYNAATGRRYNGVNVLLLWGTTLENGRLCSANIPSRSASRRLLAHDRTQWHHERMVRLLKIAGLLVEDAFRWMVLLLRSNESVQAENLFLRRQLALYIERGVQPRRVDAATRVRLAVLARLFDWRRALVVVQPATIIRWHRAGWQLFWRLKCRPGRPPIPKELRALIRRMAQENHLWGEERIANELLLKLGIRISPRTVRKYLPKRPPGRPRGNLRWSTFLKNHARAKLACDFFVAWPASPRRFDCCMCSSSSSTAHAVWRM